MPAIVCRPGVLSNPTEGKKLATKAYRDKLATAVAAGVTHYGRVLRVGYEASVAARAKKPMHISKAQVLKDKIRSAEGERIRVQMDLTARSDVSIDSGKVDLQVFFFDTVNGEEIDLTTAKTPEVKWISVLPDWEKTKTEVLEVAYDQPPMTKEEVKKLGLRFYYGFVARLIYDGVLVDEYAQPSNLKRCLYHFTPVFPRN